jgi:hypothetical protein
MAHYLASGLQDFVPKMVWTMARSRLLRFLVRCCAPVVIATACSIGNVPPTGSISVSPTSSSIAVNGSQAYTVTIRDASGKVLTDAPAVLSISPDGSCKANACTAPKAGLHVVSVSANGLAAFADLNVTPGGFDHLGVLPRLLQMTAGSHITLTAVNANSYGDPINDVTASATFSISPEGSCDANVCTATVAYGGQIITVIQGGHISHNTLQVTAGKMIKIDLEPADATVVAGSAQTYAAMGYDTYHNPVENANGATNFARADKATFTITPDGSCARGICTPSGRGVHTVTITYSGLSATARLTVI